MIEQRFRGLIYLILLVLFSACHNKELCPECSKETAIEIKFDWSQITNIPEGMTVLFYNMDNDLVYTFNNVSSKGQIVRIDAGQYRVACYNNDTEYVEWSGIANLDSLHISTRKTSIHKSRIRKIEEEIVESPDYSCGYLLIEKEIYEYVDYLQVIWLKPQPLLDQYTYSVKNIENGQYVVKTMATLSGLSKYYYLSDPLSHNIKTIMTFADNQLTDNDQQAIGSMFNLGYCHDMSVRNILTLYIWSPGGNLRATFDVTDQVRNAPDPHNVHIVINTKIVVSPPIDGEEGINPSVDDWEDKIYDIIL